MRESIKNRIDAVRRGEVPEGYLSENHQLRPKDWQYEKIGKYLVSHDEFSNETDRYPLATSSRQGLMLQSDYYSDQRYEETAGGFHVVPEGYVTYRHMSDDDIFRFNVNKMGCAVLVSPEYPVFTTSDDLHQDLLIAYLNNMKEFTAYCSAQKKGSTRTRMYFSRLGEFTMPIPSTAEQKKIVEILTTCDRALELKQKLLEEKCRQKQWLMKKLLDPNSGVRLPGFDNSEWKTFTINDYCECLDTRRKPVNAKNREEMKGRYPYWGATSVQGYVNDYLFDEEIVLLAEDGGAFDEFATRPIAAFVDQKCWVNNHAHILRAKNGKTKLVYYALAHKDIRNFINGTTRSKLTQADMLSITMSLPVTESEQDALVELFSVIDKDISLLAQELSEWDQKKKALTQLLLTGLVRVNA